MLPLFVYTDLGINAMVNYSNWLSSAQAKVKVQSPESIVQAKVQYSHVLGCCALTLPVFYGFLYVRQNLKSIFLASENQPLCE